MTLNGWTRLWIVTSVVMGLLAALLATAAKPSVDSIYIDWCDSGLVVLVPAIEKAEGTTIDQAALESSIRENGAKSCADRLRRIETKRVNDGVSDSIAPINAKFLKREADFPSLVLTHWLWAFAAWLASCAALWLIGWSVAWVRRGFSKASA